MKKTITILTLVVATNVALAAPRASLDKRIGSITVTEITSAAGHEKLLLVDPPVSTPVTPAVDPTEKVGKIVAGAKDIVALGEAIYTLVQKGKPKNQTEYAPISVVPRDPMTKEIADPFDLEGFSIPVERVFRANIKNMTGKPVVTFTYKLIYSYGGSYNGTGKYLTAVQIVPASVVTKFGWEFNATMKVAGIMNHGTKADPIAGVLVAIKYQFNSWGTAEEKNDTIHITGAGQMKSYGIR